MANLNDIDKRADPNEVMRKYDDDWDDEEDEGEEDE